MASIMLQVPVQPGLAEYLGTASIDDTQTITLEFERDVVLEDVVVAVGSGSLNFELRLVFPSSGQQAVLASPSSVTSSWMLNGLETSGGKQWYRLPARTKLTLEKTNEGELTVQLMALARNA